jgi:hypothetical protein
MSHGALKEIEDKGKTKDNKGQKRGWVYSCLLHCGVSVACVGTFIDTCQFVLFSSLVTLQTRVCLQGLFAPGPSRIRSVNFRSVVVDECAQATEPEVVLCMLRRLDAILLEWQRD